MKFFPIILSFILFIIIPYKSFSQLVNEYNNQGDIFYITKKYNEAINKFDESLNLNNKQWSIYKKRGYCKNKIKDFKGAEEDYTKAILLVEDNNEKIDLFECRAFVKTDLNKFNEAIEDLSNILLIQPNNVKTLNLRAAFKAGFFKDYQSALLDYFKANEIKPNDFEIVNGIGDSYYGLKNYMESIKYFNVSIKLNPSSELAYYGRGLSKKKLKDYRGAILDFNKAIEISKYSPKAYYFESRAISYNMLNDFLNAELDYNMAINIEPENEIYYYNRGEFYIFLKMTDKGCKDLSKAGELGNADAYDLIRIHCN